MLISRITELIIRPVNIPGCLSFFVLADAVLVPGNNTPFMTLVFLLGVGVRMHSTIVHTHDKEFFEVGVALSACLDILTVHHSIAGLDEIFLC